MKCVAWLLVSVSLLGGRFSTASGVAQNSQATISEFEVASVKQNANPSDRALVQAVPGRLLMQNFSVRTIILFAYGLADYQIAGGPDWIRSEFYDVQATAKGDTTVQQMEGPMLQALIRDRFKLAFHRETRRVPAYELTLANGTRKLQPSKKDCTPYSLESAPPSAAAARQGTVFCGFPKLTVKGIERTLDATRTNMSQLAVNLSRSLRRPVIDKTGLTEPFDFQLAWIDEPPNAVPNPDLPAGPSIFTALTEQLGLKLQSATGPVEVIVIDYIERPSPN